MPGDAVALLTVLVTTLGGIAVAHISTRRKVEGAVGQVGEQVEAVRVLAAPTGNGFARRTTEALSRNTEALGRIERHLALVDERQARTDAAIVQHLTDHAHQEDR